MDDQRRGTVRQSRAAVVRQGRGHTIANLRKAFTAGGGVSCQIGAAEDAQIGKLFEQKAIVVAKVLFPQAVILFKAVKQSLCRLAAAQGGAADDTCNGADFGLCRSHCIRVDLRVHIRAAKQATGNSDGRVTDQDQLGAGVRICTQEVGFRTLFLHWKVLSHGMMKKSILITGGARSGKSQLAERKALQPCGRAIYIATSRIYDGDTEMAARVAAHQARRGPEWTEVDAPTDLVGALVSTDGDQPRLVDCLTLWLTNLMLDEADWQAETGRLVETLTTQSAPVVFVTNEVGLGIVPENKLARAFRDASGYVNQAVAEACDEVWLAVAGHPMRVKPNDTPF